MPRYNIAPSQSIAVITEDQSGRVLEGYRWGLIPFWAKDPKIGNKMINARVETLIEKASFKHSLKRRRCLIPADGFYEWQATGKNKQPLMIKKRDNSLFAFAGLWDEWQTPDGSPLRSCTIITGEPNKLIAPVHDRMAIILTAEDEVHWLDQNEQDPDRLIKLLKPYSADDLELYPVSRQVNSPAHDSPQCIEPIEIATDDQPSPKKAGKKAEKSADKSSMLF